MCVILHHSSTSFQPWQPSEQPAKYRTVLHNFLCDLGWCSLRRSNPKDERRITLHWTHYKALEAVWFLVNLSFAGCFPMNLSQKTRTRCFHNANTQPSENILWHFVSAWENVHDFRCVTLLRNCMTCQIQNSPAQVFMSTGMRWKFFGKKSGGWRNPMDFLQW